MTEALDETYSFRFTFFLHVYASVKKKENSFRATTELFRIARLKIIPPRPMKILWRGTPSNYSPASRARTLSRTDQLIIPGKWAFSIERNDLDYRWKRAWRARVLCVGCVSVWKKMSSRVGWSIGNEDKAGSERRASQRRVGE